MNPEHAFTLLLILLLPLYLILTRKTTKTKLPPGSWGLPYFGESLAFVRAMRMNQGERWVQERVRKYGPVSKFNFLGTPTVLLHGQAANKFIYTSDGDLFDNQQPDSIKRIIGDRNIVELCGNDHKRVRGALLCFIKSDVLKMYVGRMDQEVRNHFHMYWHGKDQIQVMPLMKTLTFSIMSSLIFGIEQGPRRDSLINLFKNLLDGLLSMPINLPFTRYNRTLTASRKIRAIIRELIREKQQTLQQQKTETEQDFISCLLSLRNEDGSALLSEEEIVDNAIVVMVAGHETSSTLISLLVRLLASDPSVYNSMVEEQEEIAKSKSSGDLLTWEDLAKMKYTWRVAMETLRITPPVFCSFRNVLRDFELEGYTIPKGWRVMWAACMTHMDENIFPNPSEFNPKRFEKSNPCLPFSYFPFGGGIRMCPGNEFARIETLVAIHYLVSKFTWTLCLKDNTMGRDPFPSFKHGLPIRIKPKESNIAH